MEDYYLILGVKSNATQDEIRERFRYLAFVYHPDRFSDPVHKAKAQEDFKKINEAYSVLSNLDSRLRYDESLKHQDTDQFQRHGESESIKAKLTREEVIRRVNDAPKNKKIEVDFSNLDLSYMNLSCIITNTDIHLTFRKSNLFKADLSGNTFGFGDFSDCNLTQANFENVFLFFSKMTNANITGANFTKTKFSVLDLENIDFESCNLSNAQFYKVNFTKARFEKVIALGCYFRNLELDGYSFRNSDLRSADFQGASLKNTDFESANLSGANLDFANMQLANLENVDMRSARLFGTVFYGASLRGAQLRNASDAKNAYIDSSTVFPDGSKKGLFDSLNRFT